jgi:hypothetical protein
MNMKGRRVQATASLSVWAHKRPAREPDVADERWSPGIVLSAPLADQAESTPAQRTSLV